MTQTVDPDLFGMHSIPYICLMHLHGPYADCELTFNLIFGSE